jgi:hypothetical protein
VAGGFSVLVLILGLPCSPLSRQFLDQVQQSHNQLASVFILDCGEVKVVKHSGVNLPVVSPFGKCFVTPPLPPNYVSAPNRWGGSCLPCLHLTQAQVGSPGNCRPTTGDIPALWRVKQIIAMIQYLCSFPFIAGE